MVSLAITGLTGHTECSFKYFMAVIGLTGHIWGAFIVSELKTDSSGLDYLTETDKTDSSKSDTLVKMRRDRQFTISH